MDGKQLSRAASIAALVLLWAIALSAYPTLPPVVPTHFNWSGAADSWGPKLTIFLVPAIATVMSLILAFTERLPPRYWNMPFKITPENEERQYSVMRSLVMVLRVYLLFLFLYVEWATIQSARTGSSELAMGPFVLLICGVFVLVGRYLYTAYKLR